MVFAPTATQRDMQSNSQQALGNDTVNRDDFLRLLIAQLQHQDPLNPVENQEFVAELATFSSLEQQQQQTKLLQELIDSNQSSYTSQALSLIGKDVMVQENRLHYSDEGETFEVMFNAQKSGNATIEVYNGAGTLVRSAVLENLSAGQQEITIDPVEMELPLGNYYIAINSGLDSEGNRITYPTYLRGNVDGATFSNGVPAITVNGQTVPLSSVQAVYERKNGS